MGRIRKIVVASAFLLSWLVPLSSPALAQDPAYGTIAGEVRVADTKEPLADVLVEVREAGSSPRAGIPVAMRSADRVRSEGAPAVQHVAGRALRRGMTASDGSFGITGLAPGSYVVEASGLGWSPRSIGSVTVEAGRTAWVVVELEPVPFHLDDLVVRADRAARLAIATPPGARFEQQDLERTPHLGDDVFRALKQLPGVASSEFTSKLHLRGAGSNALDVRLDGLELVEPFHLKDLDGALSIVDEDALASVNLRTGGVPARERTRGVGTLQLETRGSEVDETRTSLGISLSVARALSLGPLADGRGTWMVSARRGFLDLLVEATDRPYVAKPRYHDVMAKVEWQLNPTNRISAHALTAGDDLLHRTDELEYRGRWTDTYAWLKWDHGGGERFSMRTVLSGGMLTKQRDATIFDPPRAVTRPDAEATPVDISDRRDVGFLAIDQDWVAQVARWLRLEWGGSARLQQAEYDYRRGDPWQEGGIASTPEHDSRVVGGHASVHLADGDPAAFSIGVRYDHQTHTDEGQLSPRLNASLELDSKTTLRGGWGLYWKPQRIQELPVQDGRERFYPAEVAREVSLGIERRLGNYALATVEAYHRRIADPVPYHLNLDMEVGVLPEVGMDRIFVDPVRGESKGLEATLTGSDSGPVDWSMSYTLSSTEDRWRGTALRKPWDQRHALKAMAGIQPADGWLISVTESFHSGWPATDPRLVRRLSKGKVTESEVLPHVNTRSLPPYHRSDVRIARSMTPGSTLLEVYLDILNVYNRTNARSLGFVDRAGDGSRAGKEAHNPFLPRLFSVGITWTF